MKLQTNNSLYNSLHYDLTGFFLNKHHIQVIVCKDYYWQKSCTTLLFLQISYSSDYTKRPCNYYCSLCISEIALFNTQSTMSLVRLPMYIQTVQYQVSTTDYGLPMKPFFIEIPNLRAQTDNLGRQFLGYFGPIYQHPF